MLFSFIPSQLNILCILLNNKNKKKFLQHQFNQASWLQVSFLAFWTILTEMGNRLTGTFPNYDVKWTVVTCYVNILNHFHLKKKKERKKIWQPHYVAQLAWNYILLLQPPECWGSRHMPPTQQALVIFIIELLYLTVLFLSILCPFIWFSSRFSNK
jgi:hypothetical protein